MNLHINEIFGPAESAKGVYTPGGFIPEPTHFKIGARVKIVEGPCALGGKHSYAGRYVGCYGEIVRLPELTCSCRAEEISVTIGVLIDGKHNEKSQYGCYWFKMEELQIIDTEEVIPMLKPYTVIVVRVHDTDGTTLVASYEKDIHEGDVVVITGKNGYVCATVTKICENTTPADFMNMSRQVVCVVDDTAYKVRCTKAAEAVKLKKELYAAVHDFQEIALYEMIAEKSPVVAELLTKYKDVTGT